MLFDPRPKSNRRDLFDREAELEELESSLLKHPLTVLLGIRRIGKTSVLRVALNELGAPYVYLDLRALEEEGYSKAALYRLLSDSLSNAISKWNKLADYLRAIKGVQVSGLRVELDWGEKSLSVIGLLNKLNEYGEKESRRGLVVVALDEAQALRYLGGRGRPDFGEVLAYAYDNLPALRFALTGSEVGLLFDMLRLEDPASPLYGRFVKVIKLERFDRAKSIEFLRKGFAEIGTRVSDDVLEAVYERVDGIVGWLAYFGYSIATSGAPPGEVIEEVAEKAMKLVGEELGGVLRRSRYYKYLLKAVAMGADTWSSAKKAMEAWLGRPIQNAQFSGLLRALVGLGLLEKAGDKYVIPDPLVAEYARRL